MADATTVTELVIAACALAAGCITPLISLKRKSARDKEANALSSWAQLNDALQEEIRRVTGELERQRADYQSQLNGLRADYQSQLDAARRRHAELEAEVAALQRALRGASP